MPRCQFFEECDSCLNREHDPFECDDCEDASNYIPENDEGDYDSATDTNTENTYDDLMQRMGIKEAA